MRRILGFTAVVAILELVVIVEVARWLGVGPTLGLLILGSLLGWFIVKAQGLAALRRVIVDVEARRVPGATLADGALGVAGGVLLIVPGFLTDVLGLLLLIRGVRTSVRRYLRARWMGRFATAVTTRGTWREPAPRRALPPGPEGTSQPW